MSRTFFVLAAIIASASPAYAYLDPGTGSLLLQGAIAAAAAMFGMASLWWQRVKTFFSSFSKSSAPTSGSAPAAGDSK